MKIVKFITSALIAGSLVVTLSASAASLYDSISRDRPKSDKPKSSSNNQNRDSFFDKTREFYNYNTHNQAKNGTLACGSGRSKQYQHCK